MIPQSVGGGKPANVVLFVNSEKIPHNLSYIQNLFPGNTDWNSDTVATVDLMLHYSTEIEYFVSIPDESIISLGKEAIEGILWQNTDVINLNIFSGNSP